MTTLASSSSSAWPISSSPIEQSVTLRNLLLQPLPWTDPPRISCQSAGSDQALQHGLLQRVGQAVYESANCLRALSSGAGSRFAGCTAIVFACPSRRTFHLPLDAVPTTTLSRPLRSSRFSSPRMTTLASSSSSAWPIVHQSDRLRLPIQAHLSPPAARQYRHEDALAQRPSSATTVSWRWPRWC